MKARLEPRIVAARIHGSAERRHGKAAGRDLITPSSQGCMKIFAISTNLRLRDLLNHLRPVRSFDGSLCAANLPNA
jgi:hypothetical protein